jgi:hypothetical protein
MSYLDEIAQKRKDALEQQKADSLHSENIGAVENSGKSIVDVLRATDEKAKDVHILNKDLATKEDVGSLIKELQQMHLTNLLEATKAPQPERSMNITDSALYVGDSIKQLESKIMAQLNDTSTDDQLKAMLTSLQVAISDFKTSNQGDTASMAKTLKKLSASVDAIDVRPVVHVDAPQVTVKAPKVDLQPLQDTLQKYMQPDDAGIDLDDYRAQDITNSGDTQYIGFVNPTGGWYIIENKTRDNSLRYLFGTGNYIEAFAEASSYNYLLLNEAVNAVSA